MKIKRDLLSNEFLFAIVFFLTAILKPLTIAVSNSTQLLLFFYFLMFFAILLKNKFILNFSGKLNVILSILVLILCFIFDFSFRKNSMTLSLFYDFFRCGIIPFIFLTFVRDYKKLLFYWGIVSICVGVMYCLEPINNYQLTGNYMQFGYGEMLPAYLGSIILTYFFQKKWTIPLAMLFFLELCIFANKGAILAAVLSFITIIFLTKNKVDFKLYFFIALIAFLIIIFNKNILGMLYVIAKKLNFNSYSLNTLAMMLNGNTESILNLRFDIWNDVTALSQGHFIEGRGIGYYMSIYQTYPHNVFLDILIHNGIFFVLLFCYILSKSMVKIKRMKNEYKRNFIICMLLLWLIPMNISLTLWQYMPFWIYFWIVYSRD